MREIDIFSASANHVATMPTRHSASFGYPDTRVYRTPCPLLSHNSRFSRPVMPLRGKDRLEYLAPISPRG